MDNDNVFKKEPARKLDLKRIAELIEEMERAEIKEKEWLKKQQQVQQNF